METVVVLIISSATLLGSTALGFSLLVMLPVHQSKKA